MSLNKLKLSKDDNFWLYIINKRGDDFRKYENPYFTLPYCENIDIESIVESDIIMIVEHMRGLRFIGFVQVTGHVCENVDEKIKMFKDRGLNINYVTIKCKFLCNIELGKVLKYLELEEDIFKNNGNFMRKFVKKHQIVCEFPKAYGRIFVKALMFLNEKENELEIESSKTSSEIIPIATNTDETLQENEEEDEAEKEEVGLIPILVVPCKNFVFDDGDKGQYFVNHYNKCTKCVIINNNRTELGRMINACNLKFYEITLANDGYWDPVLNAYNFGAVYVPLDEIEAPFVKIMYVNNKHNIYDKCFMIVWKDQ